MLRRWWRGECRWMRLGAIAHRGCCGGGRDWRAGWGGADAVYWAVRELGLQVFVTEMDVNDRRWGRRLLARRGGGRGVQAVSGAGAGRSGGARSADLGITDRYTCWDTRRARGWKLERPLPFDTEERRRRRSLRCARLSISAVRLSATDEPVDCSSSVERHLLLWLKQALR